MVLTTAAAPASEVEAVVRTPTNMAAAKIVAVNFNKMPSLPACLWPCSLGEDLLANRRLQTLLLFWLDIRSLGIDGADPVRIRLEFSSVYLVWCKLVFTIEYSKTDRRSSFIQEVTRADVKIL